MDLDTVESRLTRGLADDAVMDPHTAAALALIEAAGLLAEVRDELAALKAAVERLQGI